MKPWRDLAVVCTSMQYIPKSPSLIIHCILKWNLIHLPRSTHLAWNIFLRPAWQYKILKMLRNLNFLMCSSASASLFRVMHQEDFQINSTKWINNTSQYNSKLIIQVTNTKTDALFFMSTIIFKMFHLNIWIKAQLLVIIMVYTSCLTSCRTTYALDLRKLENIKKISKFRKIIPYCQVFLPKLKFC